MPPKGRGSSRTMDAIVEILSKSMASTILTARRVIHGGTGQPLQEAITAAAARTLVDDENLGAPVSLHLFVRSQDFL